MRTLPSTLCALCVLCVAAGSAAETYNLPDASLVTVVKHTAVERLKMQIGPVILEKFHDVRVDDISGHEGKVHYEVTNINLSNLDISLAETTVTLPADGSTDQHVDVVVPDGHVHAHVNWRYKLFFIQSSGTADVELKSMKLTIKIVVGMKDGKPICTVMDTIAEFRSMDISIHGSKLSKIYSLFTGLFKSKLKQKAEQQTQNKMKELIESEGNQQLSSLNTWESVDDVSELNMSLASAPFFEHDAVFTAHNGKFFQKGNHVDFHGHRKPMTFTNSVGMFDIYFNEETLNSCGSVYFGADHLKGSISNDDIPNDVPVRLNTDFFKLEMPRLYLKYPNRPLVLSLKALERPVISIEKNIAITVPGELNLYVVEESGEHTLALTVTTVGSGSLVAALVNEKIDLQILTLELSNSKVQYSVVGDLWTTILQFAVNKVLSYVVVPAINQHHVTLPLPRVDNVTFENMELSNEDGYLHVTTDLNLVR